MTTAMPPAHHGPNRGYDRRPSYSSPSHCTSPDGCVDKYTTLRRPSIISIEDMSPLHPSFAPQRPSTHRNTLPPLEHIKPGSWSGLPPLGHRGATAPVTLPHPTPSIRISSPTLLTPPLLSLSSPPPFDLAKYAMSPEEKPKIFDESSSPRSVSGGSCLRLRDGRRDSVAGVVLGDHYFRRRSSIPALTDSPDRLGMSSRSQSDNHGKKRKGSDRDDRDDSDGYEPASPLSLSSRGNSQDLWLVTTRSLEAPEPALKRRASSPRIVTEKILPHKSSSSSPPASAYSSLFGWDRHVPAAALLDYKLSEAASKASHVPVRPQNPFIAFPTQFPWPLSQHNNNANGTNPLANAQGDRVAIDPALFSVRSSAGQQGDSDAAPAPVIRFPDETLASATAPAHATVDASQVDAAAVAAQPASTDASLAPPTDERNPSKDQPFSRSPELRISHKLAERKRRKEMKDLFNELRELLPAERGSKSSKWDILSKSIDYITLLKATNAEIGREIKRLPFDSARGGTAAFPPYHGYTIPQTYPGAATAVHTAPTPAPPAQPSPTNAQPAQPRSG